jgi:deazaflavin-dependent oxidoreductase (nitroreductase family)
MNQQRRHMGLYERGLEAFGRSAVGNWYLKTVAPRLDPPLLYVTDGDRLLLIASNYGKTSHPAWYRNLVANPKVEVLAGKRSGTYNACEITDPAERERAWDLALDQYAGYGDYEGRAGNRTIPLVCLDRADGRVIHSRNFIHR